MSYIIHRHRPKSSRIQLTSFIREQRLYSDGRNISEYVLKGVIGPGLC